jgi:hypothetical protein
MTVFLAMLPIDFLNSGFKSNLYAAFAIASGVARLTKTAFDEIE